VPIQLEFSTDMEQGLPPPGMTVSTGGNPVAGTFSWNSYPYGSPYWGPGNILYFTPHASAANTAYTVSWGAPLADTAGNAGYAGFVHLPIPVAARIRRPTIPVSDIANGLTQRPAPMLRR